MNHSTARSPLINFLYLRYKSGYTIIIIIISPINFDQFVSNNKLSFYDTTVVYQTVTKFHLPIKLVKVTIFKPHKTSIIHTILIITMATFTDYKTTRIKMPGSFYRAD